MAMSAKDQQGTTGRRAEPGRPEQADPSRRAVLRGAAGAGVAGVAASALAGLPASQALASTAHRPTRSASARPSAAGPAAGDAGQVQDVVVHLRDVRSGEMDIFSGTNQARLRDPDLAGRLVRAIR
jgi:hypothetical protein